MDLSRLSTEDLLALKGGDLSKVSTEGLLALKGGPATPPAQTYGEAVAGTGKNMLLAARDLAAGAVRGAGSIGATLLASPEQLREDILGSGPGTTPRREAMNAALAGLGADTGSVAFGAGKLGAEIAGTAGVGGVLANGLRRVPGVAAGAPALNALRSAGFALGAAPAATRAGRIGDMAVRSAAGGATGAAASALVDPSMAGTGAAVGAVLPPGMKAVGGVMGAAGKAISGPAVPQELLAAARAAQDAGYVIPPTQVRPSLRNRVLEGVSGKITTAQNASARNQGVTNRIAAVELGLPADEALTPDVLAAVRDRAGQAYAAVASAGQIAPGPQYSAALDAIEAPFKTAAAGFPNAPASPVVKLVDSLRSPSFDSAAAVEKIKALRTGADDAFRTGNTDVGRAAKAAAKALEDAVEEHLQASGNAQLLKEFRDARTLIAKTYSVQKATNAETGSVDARKLAAQLQRGKPLSGGLRDAAGFAARFPKAAQATEGMGSLPQTSPLDWHALGAASLATGNPLAMLGVGVRPLARAAVLSPMVQNGLAPPTSSAAAQNALLSLLGPGAQLGYRAAPLLWSGQ